MSDEQIKKIFLKNGFTIKEGHDDLQPYVYKAAKELLLEHDTNKAIGPCYELTLAFIFGFLIFALLTTAVFIFTC